jgi:hypothetical protein
MPVHDNASSFGINGRWYCASAARLPPVVSARMPDTRWVAPHAGYRRLWTFQVVAIALE